jgi:hypothetical protein
VSGATERLASQTVVILVYLGVWYVVFVVWGGGCEKVGFWGNCGLYAVEACGLGGVVWDGAEADRLNTCMVGLAEKTIWAGDISPKQAG